jgi:hypothetical protein
MPVSWSQETVEKTGRFTGAAEDASLFKIDGSANLSGSLKILSKTGNEIEIDYRKWARAGSKSQAERFLDLIEVKMQPGADRVVLSILTPSDSPWGGTDYGVGLDIFVRLPEKMHIDCDMRFMKLDVRGPFAGIRVISEFSELNLEEIKGPVEMTTSFAPVRLHNINGSVRAETRYSLIEASNIIVALGSAIFQNTGGPISLREIRGPVEAYTSHSKIVASDIDAAEGSVVFRTSYSPIEASAISGEIICETSFSNVEISAISLTHGQSKIETSYSPINAEFARIDNGQLFVYNNYNDINLTLPAAISSQIVAMIEEGGRIHSTNLPVRPTYLDATRLEGTLGGGGARIELKVDGIGTIDIAGR